MALEAIYESKDEIPEGYEDLYEERDGKFELTGVNGIKTPADVERVQQGAQKEREQHKATKEALKKFEPLQPVLERYNSADELLQDIDRIDELKHAAEGKVDENKLNEMVEARLKSKVSPVERERDKYYEELNNAQQQLQQYQERERQRTIHDAVRKAASDKQVVSSAMDDVLMLAERVFDVDDDGNVITKEDNGFTPGVKPDVWLSEIAEKRPHWWPASQGSGARGSGSGGAGVNNPFTAENWNMTEQSKIYNQDPEKAEQLAKAAGTTVGGGKPQPRK